jgi:hypothetical protein
MSDHPSYLELDRVVLGSEHASATREHVEGCTRCSLYVERVGRPDVPPAWVHALAPQRPGWRKWFLGAGFAVAAAAAVLLLVVPRIRNDRTDEPSYTTVKGSPTVGVHIKRGTDVFLWDGVEPVKPGDRIRLEVAASGYRRVQVLAGGASLFDDALPETGALQLPAAWEVDAQPGAEILDVVLFDRAGGTWRTTLTMPKHLEGTDR